MSSPYQATEAEIESIGNAGVTAASNELLALDDENCDSRQAVLACLRAFKAAAAAVEQGAADLLSERPEYGHVIHGLDIGHIVASAMVVATSHRNEIHPLSEAGWRLLMFVATAQALEGMQDVLDQFKANPGIESARTTEVTSTIESIFASARYARGLV